MDSSASDVTVTMTDNDEADDVGTRILLTTNKMYIQEHLIIYIFSLQEQPIQMSKCLSAVSSPMFPLKVRFFYKFTNNGWFDPQGLETEYWVSSGSSNETEQRGQLHHRLRVAVVVHEYRRTPFI